MIPSTHGDARRRIAARAIGAAILLGAFAARAEPLTASAEHRLALAQRDPVAAEALFRAGRDLLAQGNYAEACPKFETSFALDPSTGTLLNIAKCNEHDGKIATAWENYTRALVLNQETQGEERRRTLEDIAKQGIDALAPRLPKLSVVVRAPPPGLTVLRDGKEIPASALGEALPVDPGQHQVSASAPGYRAEQRSVTLEEGKLVAVEVSLVKVAPGEDTASQRSVPVWAWVTGGVGLALGGAAVFFLVDDLAAIRTLRANCHEDGNEVYCAPGYDPAPDNARKNRGFGLFVGLGSASLIAIGVSVVGIARSRPAKKPASTMGFSVSPLVGPGSAGAAISGRF